MTKEADAQGPDRVKLTQYRWSRVTPGWPNPSEWITRLAHALEVRNAAYKEATDSDLRRNKAAAMLGAVLAALHELPPFGNGEAHLPLKDLLIFLSDLERGRSPDWAQPTNVGGTSVVTTADEELRYWATAMVHVLWSTGLKPTQSYKLVAKGLTKHGRRGKDGGEVKWRSVQQWCINIGHPKHNLVGRKILNWWETTPCPHGDLLTNCRNGDWQTAQCPDARALAIDYSENIWDIPHLRT